MNIDRRIRVMAAEEKQAKREWGTGGCQVRRCTARAAYLLLETCTNESGRGEWWQYCCARHARRYASQHGLQMPPLTISAPRKMNRSPQDEPRPGFSPQN